VPFAVKLWLGTGAEERTADGVGVEVGLQATEGVEAVESPAEPVARGAAAPGEGS